MILTAILDFVEETEKRKKNYQANSPGHVCILQIFVNNPSRGFRVRAEVAAAVSAKTIILHHHIVNGDIKISRKIPSENKGTFSERVAIKDSKSKTVSPHEIVDGDLITFNICLPAPGLIFSSIIKMTIPLSSIPLLPARPLI